MATKLSPHFTYEEFTHSDYAKKHGINNDMGQTEYYNAERLCLDVLEPIRDELGMPINITSGYRSPELNSKIGGAKYSQHMTSSAADCVCKDNKKLFDTAVRLMKEGEIEVSQIIWEFGTDKRPDWVHIGLNNISKHNEVLKATKKNGKTIYTKLKI